MFNYVNIQVIKISFKTDINYLRYAFNQILGIMIEYYHISLNRKCHDQR